MFGHDIIVMGASTGGVDALPRLIGSLPKDLPASVFIVLHISAQGPGLLPEIISRVAGLSVAHGIDGETVRQGHVYVAPPDHHLQVVGRRVRLSRGPRENFHRPSIDALFRSAAHSYGPRVVGVVLTGYLDPECHGPLWETKAGPSLQFRCHVGHAYSPDSLLADHADGLERALWSAVRTFDERAGLLRRLGERKHQSDSVGKNWKARAKEHEKHADVIRKLLQSNQ
jgi:hypothetical protein